MSLLVAPVSVKAARHAVEHWHYSRKMPMPPFVCYGAWESDRYVGAVIFARGANLNLYSPYGLDQTQGAELVRVALRDHEAPVSQVVMAAIKRLRASSPGLRLLVSFADPSHGHHGGIYQAMGWVYAGRSSPEKAYRDKAGRVFHSRVVRGGYQFGRPSASPKNVEPIQIPGKHRYLLPLDRAMRRKIAKMAHAYPQACGRGVDGDAPAFRAGEVGSTPADRSSIGGAD